MSESKSLEYYMGLAYPIHIYPEPDGSGYTAEIPDLPGCITCADTEPELWEMIEDAKRTWFEGSLAEGLPIPEPGPHFFPKFHPALKRYRELRRQAKLVVDEAGAEQAVQFDLAVWEEISTILEGLAEPEGQGSGD